jgi:diguanylate cyclase
VGVPLISGSSCFGVLSTLRGATCFGEEDLHWLTLLAAMCAPHLEIARLSALTEQDPLTGALNRRGFDRVYPPSEVEARTMVDPLCVVVVDLDHFKKVNDTYGHAVGDEVLRIVMSELQAGVRRADQVVRLGGEEFLLLLPETTLHRASRVAERIRERIARRTLRVGSQEVRVTISMGVAERALGEPRTELISRADVAMYEAKSSGRNRVVVAETPNSTPGRA